jgi:hypothetical protein
VSGTQYQAEQRKPEQQQAQWPKAIEVLEQARAWYAMVGGDTECVSGYFNAAWRLARVHTRRGDLEAAKAIIAQSDKFAEERTATTVHGFNRFGFYDRWLHYRLRQQQFENDFTTWALQEGRGLFEDD